MQWRGDSVKKLGGWAELKPKVGCFVSGTDFQVSVFENSKELQLSGERFDLPQISLLPFVEWEF